MAAKTFGDYVNILKGTQVVVEDDEGQLFTGVLRGISEEMEVELSYAQKLPISEETKFILSHKNTMPGMKLKATRLSGDYQTTRQHERAFRTDMEIGVNGDDYNLHDKDLQRWEADGDECLDEVYDMDMDDRDKEPTNGKWKKKPLKKEKEKGWSVDEMFRANKDKCVGESSFDENLTQYSNVEVGERTKEQLERAEELARQIEMNPISKRNAFLENDDEERDLDARTSFTETERQKQAFADKNKNEKKIQKKELTREKLPPSKSPPNTGAVKEVVNADIRKEITDEIKTLQQQTEQQKEGKKEEHSKCSSPKRAPTPNEEKKSKFIFNPGATPFIPKQRDLSSNPSPLPAHPPPTSVNTFNNIPSQLPATYIQIPTVQMQQNAQIPHGLQQHSNLLYNNAIVYPQQQHGAVIPNIPNAIPLYATYAGNPVSGPPQLHPGTIFVQPNQQLILQQPGIPQQFIPVSSAIMPQSHQISQPQNHQQSRTGTPTNGGTQMQQQTQQQTLTENSTAGNPLIQQPIQQTTIYHQNNPVHSAQTGLTTGALPLMNIPQMPPQSMMQVAYPPQQLQQYPNGGYGQPHQQLAVTHSQPQQQPIMQTQQAHALSRSNSVQPQPHYQQINMQHVINQHQQQAVAAGIYNANAPPYAAHSLIQQPQYHLPYFIQQNTGVIPPGLPTMPPPLTHTNIPPPSGHGTANNIGRQQQQQY